jgi:hypothetical protein
LFFLRFQQKISAPLGNFATRHAPQHFLNWHVQMFRQLEIEAAFGPRA